MTGISWWQRGIVYEIYLRSFMDHNGDGVGDLQGMVHRLDYLAWLGVDALWLTPIHPSPMVDFGYDVADYTSVDPLFGALGDVDRLVAEAHRREIKLILDFVPNHTSDQHPWFQASRSSRKNPKRGWYIWRDPAPGGGPPNNWLSVFGGEAWEWDANTEQYYYHLFFKEQPDLNWRNPEVRRVMHDALRFWLDRRVDGFRIDAVWRLIKDDRFRDNPPNSDFKPGDPPFERVIPKYTGDQPEVHDVIAKMRRVTDAYRDRLLIGEIYRPVDRLVAYYGTDLKGLQIPTNYQLVEVPWTSRDVARLVWDYEWALPKGAWPNWALGNHDRPRIASRVGLAQARVAAMLLLTLRGTPTIYYGDELGMRNVPIGPDHAQDPLEKHLPGFGPGRDPERAPMQWNGSSHAGFTTGIPWLPVAADACEINAEAEAKDPLSMLTLYRRLIGLRRAEAALSVGRWSPLMEEGDLLAYVREHDGRRLMIALNFGSDPLAMLLPTMNLEGRILLSTHLDRAGEPVSGEISLRADEGAIVAIGASAGTGPNFGR